MGIRSSFFVLKLLQLRLCKGPKSRTQGALRKKKCAFARNPDAPVRTSDSAWCVLTPEMRKAPDENRPAVLCLPMRSNPIACCVAGLRLYDLFACTQSTRGTKLLPSTGKLLMCTGRMP